MNDLSKRIAALSPEQRAFFEQQLKQRGLSAPTVQVIPKRPDLDEIPLSFGQQRLWFLNQFDPDSPAYNGPSAVRLSGPLDVGAVERSLNEVVRRHEVLRTTFTQGADGHPMQVIADHLDLPLPVYDLRTQPAEATTAADQERMAAREAEALRLAAIEFRQPFDLERGPLLRAQLLRLAETEYILLFTVHHIVSDGWSTELLIAEVTAFYAVFAGGQPAKAARLPELVVQYADFAVWQRTYLQGAVLESQLAYWRNQLAGAPELLELPTDRPRPAVQSYHGGLAAFSMERSLAHGLAELARHEGVTLFMVLLAAFDVLLHRWSGQDDLIVGTMMSGRNRSELNNVMGFLANNLALRSSLAGDPTFRELVQRVRTTALEAYKHQDVPFELLVEKLNPSRSRSHAPLFQVIFTLQNELVPTREVAGVTMRPIPIDSGTAKLDLFMFMWEGQDRLTGTLEYSTDLFEDQTIERLIGEFKVLLGGIIADPNRRISALPLLTEAEQQLLYDWNRTGRTYSETQPIHAMIAAQAARTPDAIAVVFDRPPTTGRGWRMEDGGSPALHPPSSILHPQYLTYRELDRRANRLAHYLQSLGVGPEVRVGVCMERSLELVVGLLGVLKAGAAYVPLDTDYPSERLAFMLADAGVAVLLTATNDQRRPTTEDRGLKIEDSSADAPEMLSSILYPLSSSCAVVDLRADWPAIAAQPDSAPPSAVNLGNLAYVIYTSGSTGRPKGAMNSHRAIANRLCWMQDAFSLSSADAVLQKTPYSFDVSVWEFFWPLLAGARLVLARPGGQQDPDYLVALIAAQQVTTVHFVPSMLRLFLEAPDLAPCGCLRRVICSGEALPYELQERCFARLDAELHNLYGPTEAAVDVTAWACERGSARAMVPIGRPIANTQIYLLDRQMRPVPVGVAGELHIAGVQLARGYLGRPDLTAEKFVPNPFADQRPTTNDQRPTTNDKETRRQGDKGIGQSPISNLHSHDSLETQHSTLNTQNFRLYRTGDLARYLPDGTIEFLGRIDHQIKLRGFRIELGEIEAVLSQHPELSEAAVVAQDQHLVAYIVPKIEDGGWKIEDRQPDASEMPSSILHPPSSIIQELRAFLKQRLPEYMVPAVFVPLRQLPLTPNGKLDRRALPDAGGARPALEQVYVAPRTPTEAVLALIWAEVLGVDQVGVFDNFFELGGHSLRAILLLGRVRAAFQIALPLQSMFESTTVAALAALLIEHETQPGRTDKIARLLQRIKGVSGEELQTDLEQRRQQNRVADSVPGR